MKTLKHGLMVTTLVGFSLVLSACAGDGYSTGYTSMSVGVSSYDGNGGYGYRGYRDRDFDGIPNRYDRDRDGDGVPNRFDDRPNDPYLR